MSDNLLAVMYLQSVALTLAPVLPLLLAIALQVRQWQEWAIRLTPWATLPALLVLLISADLMLDLSWVLLGSRLGIDQIGRVFLSFTAVIWLVAGVYAQGYLTGDRRRVRFFTFYLLTMSGNLGLIVAQDVISFYLFYTLMSFAAYGLIVHYGDHRALHAGRVYIYLVVLGEVLLFAGLLLGTSNAGGLHLDQFGAVAQSNLVIGLLLAGFGIKVGALPTHVWLPLAHRAAPAPASAVLGGVMINAGLLGWLRFLPFGQIALPEWSLLCIVAGFGAAIFGVVVGVTQEEPKTVLAYSTISQIGLITGAAGIALAFPVLWTQCLSVILIFSLHHAFAKSALFLGAGLAPNAAGATRRRQLVVAGLLVAALALAGLPMTSGAVAKTGLKSLTYLLPASWSHDVAVLISLVTIGTTLLMSRFLYLVWMKGNARSKLANGLALPFSVSLGFVVFFIWLWPVAGEVAQQSQSLHEIWSASWPLGLGILIGLSVWYWSGRPGVKQIPAIPAGDILLLAQWLVRRLARIRGNSAEHYQQRALQKKLNRVTTIAGSGDLDVSRLMEIRLRRWRIFGIVFLSLLVLFFLTLVWA